MQKIESKALSGTVLIYGEENYLIDLILEVVRKMIGPMADFNIHVLSPDNLTDEALEMALESLPIGGDMSCVIIDPMDLSQTKIKAQEVLLTRLDRAVKEDLPDRLVLLIHRGSKPYSGKFFKSVQKHGKVAAIGKLNEKDLTSFIVRQLQRKNLRVQRAAVQEIIERSGYLIRDSEKTLYDIVNELDKIVPYATDGQVTVDTVEKVAVTTEDDNIFHFLDAFTGRRLVQALEGLGALVRAGNDGYRLFFMIVRRVRSMALLRETKRQRLPQREAMTIAQLSKFEYEKVNAQDKYTREEINAMVHDLADLDLRMKTGRVDVNAELERLLISWMA